MAEAEISTNFIADRVTKVAVRWQMDKFTKYEIVHSKSAAISSPSRLPRSSNALATIHTVRPLNVDLTCKPYWTLVDTPSAGFVGIYRSRRKTVWFLNEGL